MLAYLLNAWLNRGIVNEFEFEIKPGRRLPPETRMEMPVMSYEQELLNTPVPFENRVNYISEYIKVSSREHSFSDITAILSTSPRVVKSMLNEVAPGFTCDESGEKIYEPYTLEVLIDELIWEDRLDQLDDLVSSDAIGEVISKGSEWVERHAYGMGVPFQVRQVGKRTYYVYPKETAQMLRIYVLHLFQPPGWYSVNEVAMTLGKDPEWVTHQVEKHNLVSEFKISNSNSQEIVHLPPETIAVLHGIKDELPQPAGDWMTVERMSRLLGKGRSMIEKLIDTMHETVTPEDRLTDINTIHLHYPPRVYEFLQWKVAELPSIAKEGWMTAWALSIKFNKTHRWIMRQLDSFEKNAELMLTPDKKPRMHYPPEAVDYITSIIENLLPPANGWVSMQELVDILKKHRDWITARLSRLDIESEVRLTKSGAQVTHYHPDTIDRLRLLREAEQGNLEKRR